MTGAAASLVLSGLLLAAPTAAATPLEVERLELNVHLDPNEQALYATAKLVLRNRGYQNLEILEFTWPEALSPHVDCNSAWGRQGELPWRLDPPEKDTPRRLLVALLSPLRPGKKLVLGINYELALEELLDSEALVLVSPQKVQLRTTGWYPLPRDSDGAPPPVLRLTVRLPKEWRVSAPFKLKKINEGTALASYELEVKSAGPGQLLLRATPPP
jgi:hypothetical protein